MLVLSLVGTPIGNLEDLSPRARRILGEADLIAAEDTRHTLRLLNACGITKPLLSYHEHNEAQRTSQLIEALREGQHVALVTDAGMPSVSDPGARLIASCATEGLEMQVVPGPSAVVTAYTGSGFRGTSFFFGGFLSVKQGRRTKELLESLARDCISIFFESPHRLVRTLQLLADHEPGREVCVCREMTKIYEEYRRGPVEVVLQHYTAHPPRGEIVLVIDQSPRRSKAPSEPARDTLLADSD